MAKNLTVVFAVFAFLGFCRLADAKSAHPNFSQTGVSRQEFEGGLCADLPPAIANLPKENSLPSPDARQIPGSRATSKNYFPIAAYFNLPTRSPGVTAYESDLATRLTGKFSQEDGPNCFNAVLLWHGLEKQTRMTYPYELQAALDDHFLQLDPGEKPKFGDILVIWSPYFRWIAHASIYIDGTFVWQKRNPDKESPWGFYLLNDMLEEYFEKPYCRGESPIHHILKIYRRRT